MSDEIPNDDKLLHGCLHDRHVALEANMADEAGWRVPLSYSNAAEEVLQVRCRAGVCDVSHAGRIRIRGDGALDLLERTCTADLAHQEFDTSLPTLLCNERGGVLAAGRLIRLESFWVLVTDPLCREKVLEHLGALAGQFDAKVDDQTQKTAMLSVDGPRSPEILDALLPFSVGNLPAGAVKFGTLMIARYIAERVDATGDWGVQVSVPNMMAVQAWRFITEKAGDSSIPPIGLAARDVMRIEAGFCRYGHELNETIDPISAGLQEHVDFAHDFLGRDALKAIGEKGPSRKRVGLRIDDGAAGNLPKMGTEVFGESGGEVGTVTSGTFSPTLDAIIAQAYLVVDAAEAGTVVRVGDATARVVDLPFYRPCERS